MPAQSPAERIRYRIAVTKAGQPSEGRAYLDRRGTEGKSKAVRVLKRFLVRRIVRVRLFVCWQHPAGRSSESSCRVPLDSAAIIHGAAPGRQPRVSGSCPAEVWV